MTKVYVGAGIGVAVMLGLAELMGYINLFGG